MASCPVQEETKFKQESRIIVVSGDFCQLRFLFCIRLRQHVSLPEM
jgi:hypothetical protein